MPEVQDPVVKLCCSWWELKAPGREIYVPQTLPYLLVGQKAYKILLVGRFLCVLGVKRVRGLL